MKTVSFQSVLNGAAIMWGLVPAENLLADQATALTEMINHRTEAAWHLFPFQDFDVMEERRWRADYEPTATYADGDEVWDAVTEAYYQSQQPANTGNALGDSDWWLEVAFSDLAKKVELEQAGQTKVDTLQNIWTANPDETHDARPLEFRLRGDWAWVPPQQVVEYPATVWLEGTRRPSRFTTTVWAGTTTYHAGERVFRAATGECYQALRTSTNKTPENEPLDWALEPMPEVLAEYLKRAVYADALRSDGQQAKANNEEAGAERMLMDKMRRECMRQGQAARWGVRRE